MRRAIPPAPAPRQGCWGVLVLGTGATLYPARRGAISGVLDAVPTRAEGLCCCAELAPCYAALLFFVDADAALALYFFAELVLTCVFFLCFVVSVGGVLGLCPLHGWCGAAGGRPSSTWVASTSATSRAVARRTSLPRGLRPGDVHSFQALPPHLPGEWCRRMPPGECCQFARVRRWLSQDSRGYSGRPAATVRQHCHQLVQVTEGADARRRCSPPTAATPTRGGSATTFWTRSTCSSGRRTTQAPAATRAASRVQKHASHRCFTRFFCPGSLVFVSLTQERCFHHDIKYLLWSFLGKR